MKKNLTLQTIYQILNTIIPLATAPYLSRVLGPTQLGAFAYHQSIANYFVLFAMLGITTYGTREISTVASDVAKRSRTFHKIYRLQLITCLFSLVLYLAYFFLFCREYRLIALLLALELVACALNVGWLFFGMERFKTTVTMNIVVRLLSVASIFLFVKKAEDLWIYALALIFGNLLNNAYLFLKSPGLVKWSRVPLRESFGILKPMLVLFVPIAAMSVYHIMDKTMLGLLASYDQTGFYISADKVINIPIGIIGGIGTVLMPRISALLGQGKNEEAKQIFHTSLVGTIMLSAAMSFGIAAVAREFVPHFFGPGYEACVALIWLFTPVMLIKSYAFSMRYQFLIPWHQDKLYIYSVLIGALVNLVVNLALIPRMGAVGATIGTLSAELAACLWQYIGVRRTLDCRQSVAISLIFLIPGSVMLVAVRLLAGVLSGSILSLLAEVAAGIVVYVVLVVAIFLLLRKTRVFQKYTAMLRRGNQKEGVYEKRRISDQ